ncbi:ABC transporter permease [Acuticoccus sp. M5D2P5]|uniref:ABC transporter permease n=1 Tax=Acuticoccus kalidii TaxID=2910977 RepID=UPI001F3F4893|nr:ABC transporter permease [Acuticoccus kalidii]MCF3935498.1 ABC transporter permease [Acuticoccus kalidii]
MNVTAFWERLSPFQQDLGLFVALLVPALLVGLACVAGYRPYRLVGAMLWRFRWTNLLFVLLIAASVGIGVGLIAQERGLRQGTARAAEKFDLIVAAPGSEMTMLLAAVYLQPADVPLVSGDVFNEIAANPRVAIAAPLAFGDSYEGASVIGTTAQFVTHLSGALGAGRVFETTGEAVAGAAAPLAIGDIFTPAHGHGDGAEADAHAGADYRVVGKMAPTGSPWDRAILVPVEAVWMVHGLAPGHGPEWDGRVGPPFAADAFPGTPAILVRADELWANYALRSEYNRNDVMAFFPGAVLAQLHGLLGDVRQVMSILAIATQMLVTAGVLTGLVVLTRLYAQRLALLRALGAPARFAFAVVWSYAAALIGAGALLGAGLGFGATIWISRIVSARTDILVTASFGWPEAHLLAAFVSVTIALAMLPALAALSRDIVADLRG